MTRSTSSWLAIVSIALFGLSLGVLAGSGSTSGYQSVVPLTSSSLPSGYRSTASTFDASGNNWIANVYDHGVINYGSLSNTVVNASLVVAKYSSAGSFLLVRSFQGIDGTATVGEADIAVDALGQVTVYTSVYGSLRINSSAVITASATYFSPATIQLSNGGVILDAKIGVNTDGNAIASDIVVDAVGHLHFGGNYNGTLTFLGQSLSSSSAKVNGFIIEASASLVGVQSEVISGTGSRKAVTSLFYNAPSNTLIVGIDFKGTAQVGSNSFSDNNFGSTIVGELNLSYNWVWSNAAMFSGVSTSSQAVNSGVARCGNTVYTVGKLQTTGGVSCVFGPTSLASSVFDGYVATVDTATGAFTSANRMFASNQGEGVEVVCDPTTGGAVFVGMYQVSATLSGTALSSATSTPNTVVAAVSTLSVFSNVTGSVSTGTDYSMPRDAVFNSAGLLAITGEQGGSATYSSKKLTSGRGFLVFYKF